MLADLLQASPEYKEFDRAVKANQLSHAYLIIGADTEARKIYCNLLAISILCKNNSCFTCTTCEKILSLSHGDIKFYNDDSKMRVKDAETLILDTHMKGWESERKLYFINNAETLAPQVQNKLLKVYEEPPTGVTIFLMASTEASILQTINSRAKKLFLPTFSTKVICQELIADGIDRRTAETAAVFSGGNFDRARLFANGHNFTDVFDAAFSILINCKKSTDIVEYINNTAFSKDNISITLEFFEIILRDTMQLLVCGGTNLTTINRDFDLETIKKGFSAGGIAMAIIALANGRKMLSANISAQSVAERILFDILEAKYKWQ